MRFLARCLVSAPLTGSSLTRGFLLHPFWRKSPVAIVTDRFHNELSDARVMAFNSSLILFEMFSRARGLGGWQKIIARNRWFQRKVVKL